MPNFINSGSICKDGWELANGNCYLFGSENLTKPDAKRICYDLGAGLLLISNSAENEYITSKTTSG